MINPIFFVLDNASVLKQNFLLKKKIKKRKELWQKQDKSTISMLHLTKQYLGTVWLVKLGMIANYQVHYLVNTISL